MAQWLGKILSPRPGGVPLGGWYAATDGSATGAGTIGDPWTIGVAFDGGYPTGTEIQPGDTLWLRGGTYSGTFDVTLTGVVGSGVDDSGGKIHVKQYPGEVAIIDGGTAPSGGNLLDIKSTYTWFWDFTLTSSSTDRTSAQSGSSPSDVDRPYHCINLDQTPTFGYGTGCKFINMVAKNCMQGFGLWNQGLNVEVYGCLVYYNGWDAPDRDHGHGYYSQNEDPSTRVARDNIFFGNYDWDVQMASGGGSDVENHTFDGNIIIPTTMGALQSGGAISCGGGTNIPIGNVFTNNAIFSSSAPGAIDFSNGNDDLVFTDNLQGGPIGGGGDSLKLTNQTGTPVVTGNKIYSGQILPVTFATDWPTNDWYQTPAAPTGETWTLVRPNLYATGRGHVAIYNFDHDATVSVDVSSFLTDGDDYAIYHAMDPQGTAAQTGTLSGTNISFPMTGLTVETPVGASAPSVETPDFAAFVVVKT